MKIASLAAGVGLFAALGPISAPQALSKTVVSFEVLDSSDLLHSNAFSAILTVEWVALTDHSGLKRGDPIAISGADGTLTLSWAGANGLFTESLTKSSAGFDFYLGTLTGVGYSNISADLSLRGSVYDNYAGTSDSGDLCAFRFSPGVVPEPSTWAMMLAGFAALSFPAYRSRTRTVVPS